MKVRGKPLLWAILPLFLLTPPLLWQGTRFAKQLADAERIRTQNTLELHANALQRSFDRIEARLDSLTAFVSALVAGGKEIDAGQFNTFAEGLHASAIWIRAFQVVSNGIVTHTYPVKGNEAVLGYNLLADPRPVLRNDVLRAERTGRVTITGPIDLVQGGLGILIRKPLAGTNAASARLAAIILNIAPLLNESGLGPNAGNDLQLALRRETGEVFFGSPTVFQHQPVTHRIALPDGAWEIAGCPLNGWQPAFSQPVLLFYAGGLAVVFLFSTLFWVLARSRANLSQTVQQQTAVLRNELAARQHSQEQFRLIMENLTDMVAVLDLSGRRLYNSPSYGKILRDPGQLVGSSSFAEVHPEDRSRVEQVFQDTVRSGVGHRLQYRMVNRNGEARHIESQGSVIREDSGQVAQVVVVSRDVTERQRMEEALRESERQLSLILNNVSDVIFAVAVEANGNFRFTAANRRFLEATALLESQIVGALVRDVIPEPAQVSVFQKYREAIQTGQPVRWEEVSDYPAGTKVSHITVVPVFDAHGNCTQLVGMVHDITDRKQAEVAIQRERDFSDAVLNSLPGMFYCYNENLRFRRWNKNFERVAGYTAAEIACLSPLDFFCGADKPLLAARIQEVFATGAAEVEADFVAKDGTRTPYYFTGLTIVIDGQRQLVGVGIDITERKQAEAALRESEERLRLLGDNLPDSYVYQYIQQPDGGPRFLYLSAGVERLHGVKADIILRDAHALRRQIAPEQLPTLAQAEADSLRNLTDFEMELRFRRADGQWRWLQVRSRPRKNFDGQVIWDGVVADFTARRQAAEEIRRLHEDLQRHAAELELRVAERTAELVLARDRAEVADRLKSIFLATMSHELRTPLNSIIGFTGILLQGLAGPLNAEQNKQLDMVRNSARHLLALINDVLDISKIEAGQIEIICKPFDLREALEKVMQSVAPLAEKKHLALAAQMPPTAGQIISDRRRVEQILLNLLSNALKFTERGGVTLTVEFRSGAVHIAVTDTGIGIKPEDLEKLFQPFRQLDSGLTRQHEGTGLGLAICKRLVERLGGAISVVSQWGAGSTFEFTLPVNFGGAYEAHRSTH